MPRGIFIDNGLVYVTEQVNDRVSIFNEAGKYIDTFGSEGNGKGQLNSPFGISVNDDIIVIAERDNHRVQIFDKNFNSIGLMYSYEGITEVNELDENDNIISTGEETTTLYFKKPHSISLDNDTIKIMDTANQLLHTFSYSITE